MVVVSSCREMLVPGVSVYCVDIVKYTNGEVRSLGRHCR